jgi:hypothetical protein
MAEQDHEPAYRELRIWLQILQDQSPWRRGRQWVLKSPHHLTGLDGFLKVFPEAKAIMTHRAVEELIPSYCSMCTSLTKPYSTTFKETDSGPHWSGRYSRAMRHLLDVRAAMGPERFINVQYSDLLHDPLPEIKRVFRQLGLRFGPADQAAMEAWLAANGREARPPHRYTPAEFGLTEAGLAADFDFYRAAFLAPSGADA